MTRRRKSPAGVLRKIVREMEDRPTKFGGRMIAPSYVVYKLECGHFIKRKRSPHRIKRTRCKECTDD